MSPEAAWAIGVATVLVAAFIGLGGAVLDLARITARPKDALRLMPIASAIGFSIYSYLCWIVLLWAPISRAAVLILGAAGIACGIRYWKKVAHPLVTEIRSLIRGIWSPSGLVLFVLCSGFATLVMMRALAPTTEGDSLWGYLFTSRWLYQKGIVFNPYNPRYSLMPFQTELVFSLSFPFGTDLIAKVTDALMGTLFTAAIYEFARRFAGPMMSFLAAISMPVLHDFLVDVWVSGKVDVLASFTCFSSIALLFCLYKSASPISTLALASFLIGTSCAQKYTVWVFVPGFLLGVYLIVRTNRGAIRKILFCGVIVLLCLLPHLSKDLRWAGNPVAPFAANLFGTAAQYISHVPDGELRTWWQWLLFPYTLFFNWAPPYWPGTFPLLVLPGLLFFFIKDRKPGPLRTLSIVGLAQFGLWILVRQQDWLVPRFLLAPLAVLLVLSARGLDLAVRDHALARVGLIAITAAIIFHQGIWTKRHYRSAMAFIRGRESRQSFLDRIYPQRAFGALQNLAGRLGPADRLLLTHVLYNVPPEKVQYIGTEKEALDFFSLAETSRLEYLTQNHFRYYLFYGNGPAPAWTRAMRSVATFTSPAPGGLCYDILERQ